MMQNVFRVLVATLYLGSVICCAQTPATNTPAPKLETEDQKTLYALGLILGRNIKPFSLSSDELAIVKAGLSDAVADAKPQVEIETYGPKVNDLAQKRSAVQAEEAKKKGQEFLDNAAKQKDATKTPSGIR